MLGVPAQEPHEDGDERERDEHHPGGDRIDRGDEHENRHRHDEREDHLGQVAGERRLEGVHARDRCCRDLGALDAVERSGSPAKPALDELQAQLRANLDSSPPSCDFEPPRRDRARSDHAQQQDQRGRNRLERRTVEAARGDPREEDGLCQNQERRDDAQSRIDRRAGLAPAGRDAEDANRTDARAEATPLRARDEAAYGLRGVIPHVLVTTSPGSRRVSPSPLLNAFGGQLMGSTARPRRSTSGRSPVNSITYG